jgi:predicted CXXCH cytochrome family protein
MSSTSVVHRPGSVLAGAAMVIAIVGFIPTSSGESIVGSRHDLSTAETPQVCEFCHTPHHANDNITGLPLWNRAETTQTFTTYGSPSMNTTPGQPGSATSYPGVSTRMCLSCHDGVNASAVVHGNVVSTKHDLVYPPGGGMPDMTSYPNCERCHPDYYSGRRRVLVLGTNLGNDHPVSMPYPNFADDPDFNSPPSASGGWGGTSKFDVKLFYGSVECSSCHEPHDPRYGSFLRKPNTTSGLCLTCHKK